MESNNTDFFALQQTLNDWVMLTCELPQNNDEANTLQQQLVAQCVALEQAAATCGLDGLMLLLQYVGIALENTTTEDINEHNLGTLTQWSMLVVSYIEGQITDNNYQELIDALAPLSFLEPLPDYLTETIIEGLSAGASQLGTAPVSAAFANESTQAFVIEEPIEQIQQNIGTQTPQSTSNEASLFAEDIPTITEDTSLFSDTETPIDTAIASTTIINDSNQYTTESTANDSEATNNTPLVEEESVLFTDENSVIDLAITEEQNLLFADDNAVIDLEIVEEENLLFVDDGVVIEPQMVIEDTVFSEAIEEESLLFANDNSLLIESAITTEDTLFSEAMAEPSPALFDENASIQTIEATDTEFTQPVDDANDTTDLFAPDDTTNTDEAIWLAPEELELIIQAINEQLLPLAISMGSQEPAEQVQTASDYQEQWGFISSAFEAVNFSALLPLCSDVDNLLLQQINAPQEHIVYILAQWTMMLANYFQAPQDTLVVQDLCDVVADSLWPRQLSDQDISQLAQALAAVNIGYDPRLLVQRKTTAEQDDIALNIAADVMPDVLASMLHELPQRTTDFSDVVQKLVRFGDPESIEVAKRIAHTLKGDGNIVGLRGIAVLTHSLEEILMVLTQEPGVPVTDLANVLLESADCLESMSDFVLGRGNAPDNALEVLQKVLDWDTALHSDDKPAHISAPPQVVEVTESSNQTAAPVQAEGTSLGSSQDTITVPVSVLNHLLQMTGEAIIYSRQVETKALQLEKRITDINNDHQGLQRVVAELQQLVEVHGNLTNVTQFKAGVELDALEMEHYNELHTVTNRLVEASTDTLMTGNEIEQQINDLKDLLVTQDRIHLDLQEKMLATLTVPVTSLVPRLQRIIRQAARQVGKEIDVVVEGENTLIDHDILHQLAEPMGHMLRNAVDHGLEANNEREFLGKREQGQIKLTFKREGNQIAIYCQDDGRGLNKDVILEKAIQKGLISADDHLTTDEIYRLIFKAGFSTRDQASEISGRGIGMDIVLRAINRMKGQLLISSEQGVGTTFEIRLPTSQIVANVSLAKTRVGWLAVSIENIQRLILLSPHELDKQESGYSTLIDDELVTVIDAETVFGAAAPAQRYTQNMPALLLQSPEHGRRVVLIEAFGESRTVIVKPLPDYLPAMAGVRGATILGDGTIAPVVDLSEALSGNNTAQIHSESDVTFNLPTALVVDDSLSVRRAMQQLLQDSGFEVWLARDGLEAVALLKDNTPDIMLVDMEMPRMNGLELTAFARNNQNTAGIPIIMITSRTTEKHKLLAQEAGVNLVLSKPYTDENLLDAIKEQREQAIVL